MTDEEKRQRIETLLLALKDWGEESDAFLRSLHGELFDLLIADDMPSRHARWHWVNQVTTQIDSKIFVMLKMLPGLLLNYRDPSTHETEVQRRADNQR